MANVALGLHSTPIYRESRGWHMVSPTLTKFGRNVGFLKINNICMCIALARELFWILHVLHVLHFNVLLLDGSQWRLVNFFLGGAQLGGAVKIALHNEKKRV